MPLVWNRVPACRRRNLPACHPTRTSREHPLERGGKPAPLQMSRSPSRAPGPRGKSTARERFWPDLIEITAAASEGIQACPAGRNLVPAGPTEFIPPECLCRRDDPQQYGSRSAKRDFPIAAVDLAGEATRNPSSDGRSPPVGRYRTASFLLRKSFRMTAESTVENCDLSKSAN